VCVCICVYIYIYICVCMCICIWESVCLCVYIYIYTYTHTQPHKQEVSSSETCRLVLAKMDKNVSVESLLPHFTWKRRWKKQVTANYRVSQQDRQTGFNFCCFKSFKNVTHKGKRTYSLKKWFSLYILLSMVLQIYSLAHLIIGSVIAAAGANVYDDGGKGKFNFRYQWRNSEVTATAWRILRKERYRH